MRVLVGDDQSDVLDAARLLLKSHGHSAVTASTPENVLKEARAQTFDVLLVDMNYARDTTSGGEGLNLLEGLRASGIDAPVVVMTAWGSIDLAVEAMRRGASDFVQKPWDNRRLIETITQQAAKAKTARTDAEIARKVQQRLLGRATTPITGLDYAGRCLPAGDIGGDYFDFVPLDTGALAFAVADVSGKGTSAALLMAHLQAALRSRTDILSDPQALVSSVNRVFWQSSPSEQYATMFYGVYTPEARTLTYVNAGHGGAVLLRSEEHILLDTTGVPVGMFEGWRGAAQQIPLRSGDRLAVVSDGVIESGLHSAAEFGTEGVLRCLRRGSDDRAEALADRILSESSSRGAVDDMTALLLRVQ